MTYPPQGPQADVPPAQRVVSPFANVTAEPLQSPARGNALGKWLGIVLAILILGGAAGYGVSRLVSNPYRTLEPFPMETYASNYHALEGSRFKATLRVENDLGYSATVGRLMVFSIEGDGRTIAALIPARMADNVFSRGQRYTAELQVGDGGMIQINSYVKN